ncbi:hypothetical protein CD351_00800 [Erythrobacter sp. KY5]|uniref:CPBP family glutamic-type intramembrane protease n=1 Tax=Erythrobacter sp. KY5 TaxID=2011159 RepID=UPI000DBEFC54|nr:CPBP family glutamic-type intramembrane protease [Erythrobacter sp. KY5]AWW72958.1 hypothetical protein CD351_00800 [Erythrobacter sp. KY5]
MIRVWANAILAEAHAFWRFLKAPDLNDACKSDRPIHRTVIVFAMLALMVIALSVLLAPAALLMGAGQSAQLDQTMSADPLRLVLGVAVLGPIVEEILFRSWLTGTWRFLAGAGVFALVLYGVPFALTPGWQDGDNIQSYLLLTLALAAFAMAAIAVRSTAGPAFFERSFRWIFWVSTILFGTLHLANYSGTGGLALLVFTLPQVLAGAVFGYARVKIGLLSAIALHMAFNAVPVGAALFMRLL